MVYADLEAEIREIQSHLENMDRRRSTNQRKAKGKASATQQAARPESAHNASADYLAALETLIAEFDAEDAIDNISTHARQWLDALNKDLKHTNPGTLLTVFGLGVIVGRLTK